jgi:hypothetical protein
MAKTAIVPGANPALSRGDDPPYPPLSLRDDPTWLREGCVRWASLAREDRP